MPQARIFTTVQLRQRAWPVLLGVEDGFSAEEYENLKMGKHRDSSTVLCDVDRSLWFYTEGRDRAFEAKGH